jgi:hypothetical protein
MGFAEPVIGSAISGRTRWLDPSHALSFLTLAPLFIWFAPDMTRKELTDFVGEKVG